jgi:hypothetical protein
VEWQPFGPPNWLATNWLYNAFCCSVQRLAVIGCMQNLAVAPFVGGFVHFIFRKIRKPIILFMPESYKGGECQKSLSEEQKALESKVLM